MIDLKTLSLIDDRLRAISPASSDQPFGELNALLCCDFFQLPPVTGKAQFARSPTQVDAIEGHQLYQVSNRTLRQTQIIRQQGEDDILPGSALPLVGYERLSYPKRAGNSRRPA